MCPYPNKHGGDIGDRQAIFDQLYHPMWVVTEGSSGWAWVVASRRTAQLVSSDCSHGEKWLLWVVTVVSSDCSEWVVTAVSSDCSERVV